MTLRLTTILAASLCLFMVSCANGPKSNGSSTQPSAGNATSGTVVDRSTLTGKLMCGYQGWFNAEGDGADRGYNHWTNGGVRPAAGKVRIDMWPDMTELPPEERYPTDLFLANGTRAELYSAYNQATVLRHFKWMQDYGIDGVFLQRFIGSLNRGNSLEHNNKVLENCREGARRYGRAYAMMYDLSGLAAGSADKVIADWTKLVKDTKLTSDPAYLHHHGKPLLALWGCGNGDDKPRPTIEDWRKILTFLKNDPAAGGVSIMLGIPSYWRELGRDCVKDAALHEVLKMADVLSPWTPGRYRTPEGATQHAQEVWKPDLKWCRSNGIDFLPVAFPGFSWHNMKGAELNAIPRLQGRFFWSQVVAAKRAGAEMLYVAMFDEVDEGTAIFKVTNQPPVGPGVQFVTYEGLPSDYYLRLAGMAGKVIRGERPVSDNLPFKIVSPVAPQKL